MPKYKPLGELTPVSITQKVKRGGTIRRVKSPVIIMETPRDIPINGSLLENSQSTKRGREEPIDHDKRRRR